MLLLNLDHVRYKRYDDVLVFKEGSETKPGPGFLLSLKASPEQPGGPDQAVGVGAPTRAAAHQRPAPPPLAPFRHLLSVRREGAGIHPPLPRLLTLSPQLLTLSPSLSSTVAHEHLKERGLFGLPPPPPGASPAEYYHLMASHRSPYGELLMQGAGAAAGAHLSDYITPIDGE